MKRYTPSERHRRVTQADLSSVPVGSRDNARRVLHIIADHADQELLVTNIGIDAIAKQIEVASITVKRCLPRLEQAGLIVVRRIRRRGNMYMLLMGDLDETMLEKVVDVFKEGKNFDQICESLSNSMVLLRNSSLSNSNPPSKYQHSDPLTGERLNNRGKTKEKTKNVIQEIPGWLNPETWNDFLEHRAEMKAPMSVKAQKLLIKKLLGHRNEGHDPNDLLETAVMNGWKSVYPPKPEKKPIGSRANERIRQGLGITGNEGDCHDCATVPTTIDGQKVRRLR